MDFDELYNTIDNFCNAHSFDVRSTFYNSISDTVFKNEKLANILVRLTVKKGNLNNKEKSIIYILRNIESLLEKYEQFEDEYICQSNRASRVSHEELRSLHLNYNTVTQDVKRMIKKFYSLIINLEDNNLRKTDTVVTFWKKINNANISYSMILREVILRDKNLKKLKLYFLTLSRNILSY